MYEDVFQHYRSLLRSQPIELGACWGVLRGDPRPLTVEEVVRRLGHETDELRQHALDEWPELDGAPLHLVTAQSAVMTVEPHGARLSSPGLLESLSADARIWSVSWNTDQQAWLTYARDGRCLATYDFLYEPSAGGDEPDVFDRYHEFLAEHVDVDEEDDSGYEQTLIRWWAAGMTVVELASGVRLETALLEGPLPTLLYDEM
ncbi:DUF6461 domain-containing protein [Streptosporangium sp. NPDC051023]|uniref:DUF6461 domain-containing protein n=1 Tax=Streptosporangium sp. NPDC051023 TaxID=3155410 RepID=UPI00344F1709